MGNRETCPMCSTESSLIRIIGEMQWTYKKKARTVYDATWVLCTNCGRKFYDAKEIKRWEKLAKEQDKKKGE
jgi:hypothetical protein